MKLAYGVKDKPRFGQLMLFSLQQLLAILSATILVPIIVGNGMSISAALFGAGVGTLVYLAFTRFKSPVFLGSSFAFLGSMAVAFAGGVSMALGYLGLVIGAAFAALVYVIIAVIVKYAGVKWIDKVMPAVVIGPTVSIIGLSLSGNAVNDLLTGNSPYIALVCGIVTLAVTVVSSVYGKKTIKMIPFIIGIGAGYILATVFTVIGNSVNVDALKLVDFTIFKDLTKPEAWYPHFTFLNLFSNDYGTGDVGSIAAYVGKIAIAYTPVAFVVFAEHLADHKNISSIIETDLLEDPGLSRTLLGDGVGSLAGAFFGGCPNTTYGESVGCVAISGNASVITIFVTALMAIIVSFIAPIVLFLHTIPNCVMGGVCIALYGFIAVSGLKMVQKVDLGDNRNLFVVSVILVCGVGGLTVKFGAITLTTVACSLILGILCNLLVNIKKDDAENEEAVENKTAPVVAAEPVKAPVAPVSVKAAPAPAVAPVTEKPAMSAPVKTEPVANKIEAKAEEKVDAPIEEPVKESKE